MEGKSYMPETEMDILKEEINLLKREVKGMLSDAMFRRLITPMGMICDSSEEEATEKESAQEETGMLTEGAFK